MPQTRELSTRTRRHSRELTPQQRCDHLQRVLRRLQQRLASARETITSLERRHEIERELARANVRDRASAALLTEIAVFGQANPDIPTAVAELRRHNPFLFRAEPRR